MTVSVNIIQLAASTFLFLIGSFCIGIALTPPGDASAEAKLLAAAVFFIGMGLVVGLRP